MTKEQDFYAFAQMLREFSHWTPWGTKEAVCDRLRALAKGGQ